MYYAFGHPLFSAFQENLSLPGYQFSMLGGWPGILLIVISIKPLKSYRILRSVGFGIFGYCGLTINNVIGFLFLSSGFYHPNLGYYLSVGLWILFGVILIRLYTYKYFKEDESLIRKTILDMCTVDERVEIKEICKTIKTSRSSIEKVILDMI
ncbi:MAG: hypothetical protein ACXAAH_12110, partial [Promethearchaeota archaeon]